MKQIIHFYFDDSGVLHKNSKEQVFVYAGYVFCDKKEKDNAIRRYKALNKSLKVDLGESCGEELKGANLSRKHKNALYKVLRNDESQSLSVKIPSVYDSILSEKKAICRYKDYVLKLLIKKKLLELIDKGKICSDKPTHLVVNIDNQLTSTNGFYNLKESIYEELRYGIINHDYGTKHKNVFSNELIVETNYCDSKHHYLIQASDILANRILNSYSLKKREWREIPNNLHLIFP